MFKAAVDELEQVLQLSFADVVSAQETADCLSQVRQLVGKLKPGFALVTDLARVESMDLRCAASIDQLMELLNQAGVRKILRVVVNPRQDIGFGIMSLFHYNRNVRIVTCQSLQEVEQALAEDRHPPQS